MAILNNPLATVLSNLIDIKEDQWNEDTETKALHEFCTVYQHERSFTERNDAKLFSELLKVLIKEKLMCLNDEVSCDSHIFTLVRSFRLLLRDRNLLNLFMKLKGLSSLVPVYCSLSSSHLSATLSPDYMSKIVREITSICQKISVSDEWKQELVSHNLQQVLYRLLHSKDLNTLQCALCTLVYLAKSESLRVKMEGLNLVKWTLNVLGQKYDTPTKHLAADLLSLLTQNTHFRDQVKLLDDVVTCVSMLKSNDIYILQRITSTLEYLGRDQELNEDIRLAGGIPMLLHVLQNVGNTNATAQEMEGMSSRVKSSSLTTKAALVHESSISHAQQDYVHYLQCTCCSTLTQLGVNDASAAAIVQNNGVYVLTNFIRPCAGKTGKSFISLQYHAFRALRFLFSLDRHRALFKRLFPPAIFEQFINVGHYQWDLKSYTKVLDSVNTLQESELSVFNCNVESINKDSSTMFTVGPYQVIELLGNGAFGSVYKAKKASDQFVAIKEIKITHPSLGKTLHEREKSMGHLLNEVTIMKEKLKHRNIVKYYKTFTENGHLYIVMELLEGASLLEHISSLKEKKMRFTEPQIWKLFLQLTLALRYIHKEKRVTHRDLSAANVMVGTNLKLTITDFGLAKQKQRDISVMNSTVGTIPYWSPELVQNLPYTEKVDIWAAGCLLYQMAAMEPPFKGSNLLTLATKIVEGDYPAIEEGLYSQEMSCVINRCLENDPSFRPDAVQVGSLLADVMMKEVDMLVEQNEILSQKCNREKDKAHKHHKEAIIARKTSEHIRSASRNLHGSLSPSLYDENFGGFELVREDMSLIAGQQMGGFPLNPENGDVITPHSQQHQVMHRINLHDFSSPPTPQKLNLTESRHVFSQEAITPDSSHTKPVSFSSFTTHFPPVIERRFHARKGSASLISMATSCLKEIADPNLQTITELQKIILITQAPPSINHNPRRQIVEVYKRQIFNINCTPEQIKSELYKLSVESEDAVECLLSDFEVCNETYPSKLFSLALKDLPNRHSSVSEITHLTYYDLKQIVESVYQELH